LARIVDRSRALEEGLETIRSERQQTACEELATLARRMRLICTAVALAVISALAVGMLIAVAFIDAFLAINLARLVAALFVGAMIAFLGEIFLAVTSARSAMTIGRGK
jgi:hypothetical protein